MNTEISTSRSRGRKKSVFTARRIPWSVHGLLWFCGLFCLAVFVFLLYFRYFGLPAAISEKVRQELVERGLQVEFDRLYLDPLGNLVARKFRLSHGSDGQTHHVQIERLGFGFNWISWWRGEPFLDMALIRNGDLTLALDEDTDLILSRVEGEIELRQQEIWIHKLRGRVLNLEISMQGIIDLREFVPQASEQEPDSSLLANVWRSWETALEDFGGSRPISLDISGKVALARPEQADVRLQLNGVTQVWRGVVVERVMLDAEMQEGVVRASGALDLLRGGIEWQAAWAIDKTDCRVAFHGDMDWSLLVPAMPASVASVLRMVRFRELPRIEGSAEVDWSDGGSYFLQARLDWQDFALDEVPFDRLYLPFSTDGKRWLIPGMELKAWGDEGTFSLEGIYEGTGEGRGRVRSTLDPKRVAVVFGEGLQPFFDSLDFSADGPSLDCRVSIAGAGLEGLRVEGNVEVSEFSYKEVAIEHLAGSFSLEGTVIHSPDLVVRRVEGEGRIDVKHDFKTGMVWLGESVVQLNTREAARVIGDKLEEYVTPYRFAKAPRVTAKGVIDVHGMKDTRLTVHVEGGDVMEYDFLGKTVILSEIDADLKFTGPLLEVRPRKPVRVFEGFIHGGQLDVWMDERESFTAKATMESVDFGQLMMIYFGNEEVKGEMSSSIQVTGKLDEMESLSGWGDLTIHRGVLYNIPVFGGFSQILNSIVPNLGYSEASKAFVSFKIGEGNIRIEKIDVFSTAFALIGQGNYHFIRDEVDLSMRVNMRGLPGLFFFPVSKLFEYRGTGTMENTIWEPKAF